MINESGTKCTYKVKHWETAVTEADGKGVSIETFNRVFNPEEVGNGFLTIQTCKKEDDIESRACFIILLKVC